MSGRVASTGVETCSLLLFMSICSILPKGGVIAINKLCIRISLYTNGMVKLLKLCIRMPSDGSSNQDCLMSQRLCSPILFEPFFLLKRLFRMQGKREREREEE
uniref:Uncharacterized protein n=1 Tax=Cacopsylla melanoneura TaxID=428564 RepID=A0A8D8U124_9HEMI